MKKTHLLAAALALFAITPAVAADFDHALLDIDGAPITDDFIPNARRCKIEQFKEHADQCDTLTLGRAVQHALLASYPDEQNLAGEEKWKRGKLALQISKGGAFDLSAEDTATAKRLVAKLYGPLVVMTTWPLLDPSLKDK